MARFSLSSFLCMNGVHFSPASPDAIEIRPLKPQDLPHLLTVQQQCYPANICERAAVLLQKINDAPAYCWLAVDTVVQEPLGYVLSHPWAGELPPNLDVLWGKLPAEADCFYVHDIAVVPRGRGLHLAERLYHTAKCQAQHHGLHYTALTAVQGAASYWARFGYRVVEPRSHALKTKLARYGEQAVFMQATLKS